MFIGQRNCFGSKNWIGRTAALCALIVLLLAGHISGAQTLYGTIVGVVEDSSGSVIPGATVTAVETKTNTTRAAVTNETGNYILSTIPAGLYTVTVTRKGFQSSKIENVILAINATARVDTVLGVGAETTTVTVSGEAAQLETDRVDVHANVSEAQLQELPQPTRTYQGILATLPGVTPPSASSGGTNNPARSMSLNIDGTSASGTSVTIDGVNAVNPWVQFYTMAVPSTDAIETVNTVSASSSADQGIMNGGGVRVQIKSGTNKFHASAYGYHISNAMKAIPYTQPSTFRRPKYIDNDDGFTVGGPILKDKLFFFGSYEGSFLRQAASGYYSLPTPNMVKCLLPSSTPIYDPATGNSDGTGRSAFATDSNGNYIIPTSRFASAATKLLAQLPSGVTEGTYTRNIFINTPSFYNLQKVDTKFDWNTTQKLRISGRYSTYPYSQGQAPPLGDVLIGAVTTDQHGNTYSTSVMATYLAKSNLIIDAVFGMNHAAQYLLVPRSNERYALETLGIPGTNAGPLPSAGGVPNFNFSNGLSNWGYGYPSLYYIDPVFQYSGNVTWIHKNHSFRFGIEVSQQHMNHQEVSNTYFSFTGGATSLNCAGVSNCTANSFNMFNSYADFLLGRPYESSVVQLTSNQSALRTWQFAPYFADTWQASRKLTVYVGTAWNYLPVPQREGRGIEYYNPDDNSYNFCGVGSTVKNCGITVQKTLFAPRAGAAYRLTPRTVLRAGYSLAPEQINMARDGMMNYPATISQTLDGANSYGWGTTLATGFSTMTAPDYSSGKLTLPNNMSVSSPAKNFVRGYTQSYNVTAQKEFGWGILAQVGYVGTLTVHQHTRSNVNYGVIGGATAGRVLYGQFGVTADRVNVLPIEHMRYRSLQAQAQKNLSNGLQFTLGYTFSQWMGYWNDANGDSAPSIQIPEYRTLAWGHMGGDRPHNFQATMMYQLPFGAKQRYLTHGAAAAIAGGWQTNVVLSRYSGTPFSISANSNTLDAPGSSQRPDKLKNPSIYGAGYKSKYFDTTAFSAVTGTKRFGTAPFDAVRGPGYFNADLSIFRVFQLREKYKLQLRGEALNVLNHPNFSNPDSNIASSTFGQILGVSSGSRTVAERYLRLGAKVMF